MQDIVLYPDVQFSGPATIEQEAFGTAFELKIGTGGDLMAFSESDWASARAVVCYHEISIDRAVLARLPNCRVIVRAGVGFDNIDIASAGERGIAVCNTPDYGTTDVADHAIALTLALLRGIVAYHNALIDDPVRGWDFRHPTTIRRLSSLVFGVVGLGRIGTATALRAKALGMDVIFFDPYLPTGTELALGIRRVGSLAELLGVSDVVSLHTPLTPETKGLISEEAFNAMKPGAVLVNTARGGVVNLGALQAALETDAISAAALDVAELEPLPASHRLMKMLRTPGSAIADRLIITPHAAFFSPSSLLDLRRKSALTAAGFLATNASRDLVNGLFLSPAKSAERMNGTFIERGQA